MAYDEKFRRKAVEFKESGHTFKQLKETFGISRTTYIVWRKNKEISGFYVIPRVGKYTRKGKISPDELKRLVEENPELYLYEIAQKFNCTAVAVFKRLKQMKITVKKRHSATLKNQKRKGRNTSQG